MDDLTAQVEQATLDAVKKNAHCALAEVMEGWKIKGQIGDNCPRSLMGPPCAVADHKPVNGKGYFVLPGDCLAATRSEVVKYEPWKALQGPQRCGYLGCKSSFYGSIGCFINDYP